MARLVWGFTPKALQREEQAEKGSPLSAEELAALGIPARKIPRVQAELARLAADPALEQDALPLLARQIARQFL